MIRGTDADDLARSLHAEAASRSGQRLTFKIDPTFMDAVISNRQAVKVPQLTGSGDAVGLAAIIQTFHQWGQPFHLGVLWTEHIFQFWIEADVE